LNDPLFRHIEYGFRFKKEILRGAAFSVFSLLPLEPIQLPALAIKLVLVLANLLVLTIVLILLTLYLVAYKSTGA
jgi:hypothetical protein